ncbi:MAG: anaerobic ribonucleoside-triphosphate reductase activating protein [Bacteroidales bacterium]|nr:anaerobic ribonucleoside-triphosphate reductase activating protein [Bacteroidales bacterium]MCM1147430.1 anaerobic ribonucleoside-triphosphate reductase activating protein [Bacteroidales bacterium]MCM1206099.1 anaerobic ribonucleoside-triphosphate reductase activating protein [Bacillota bacterium]MCM1510070.1 anaerobic ribonucleoside-triphosphate reductase activating protein [Clostridium sp.]
MKFVNESIVFQEIPDEVTLAINISNCPCRCPGCHSKYLWGDIGDVLTHEVLERMIAKYAQAITCVAFMGGDSAINDLNDLAIYLKNIHPNLKIAWYSGKTLIPSSLNKECFDYIKVGPYIEHLGPLNKTTTNQRLYKKNGKKWSDITSRFWQK